MNVREERYSGSRREKDEYRSEFQRDRDRVLYSDESVVSAGSRRSCRQPKVMSSTTV